MPNEKVRSGIHPSAQQRIDSDFSSDETKIVKWWSAAWYITRAGKTELGNSEYRYACAKPTESIQEGTGITKELVIVFSPYESFEARTLSTYDNIVALDVEQRYEKICYVLISKDDEIERKISEFQSGQENQIIVPFSYKSFYQNATDNYFIRNQLRKYFFARDLFDYSEPLKRDFLFFGRSDIVTQIIDKHKAGQNMGVFGLRKTGKTSIIYDVIRKSKPQDFIAINIDCQSPSFNKRRWNEALFFVTHNIVQSCLTDVALTEQDFSEKDAASIFEEYINIAYEANHKTILIMFDEIENISYGKSPSDHWCKGLDFVFFWQSIRSAYQKNSSRFSFCIFGTNPKCVEEATINEKDNPIFNMIQPTYISGFSVPQTREMVRKLGRIMGIKFDETIYSRLVEDYGGHPFLIRRVCSKISQMYPNRPVSIDRSHYLSAKKSFNIENTYFDMILNVLSQFYPDEYELLTFLATEDYDNFNYFVNADPSMVTHLIGYGLIRKSQSEYDFNIDSIKDYIIRITADHIKPASADEKWSLLCSQRNSIEQRLRRMVRNIIRTSCKNETDAKEYVIKKLFSDDKRLYAYSLADIFDSRKNTIYLKSLFDLIKSKWDYFSDYFGKQDVCISHMNVLNAEGRFDAHSTVPTDSEICAVDNAVRYFNDVLKKYDNSIS